jgi:hypothetical protein
LRCEGEEEKKEGKERKKERRELSSGNKWGRRANGGNANTYNCPFLHLFLPFPSGNCACKSEI